MLLQGGQVLGVTARWPPALSALIVTVLGARGAPPGGALRPLPLRAVAGMGGGLAGGPAGRCRTAGSTRAVRSAALALHAVGCRRRTHRGERQERRCWRHCCRSCRSATTSQRSRQGGGVCWCCRPAGIANAAANHLLAPACHRTCACRCGLSRCGLSGQRDSKRQLFSCGWWGSWLLGCRCRWRRGFRRGRPAAAAGRPVCCCSAWRECLWCYCYCCFGRRSQRLRGCWLCWRWRLWLSRQAGKQVLIQRTPAQSPGQRQTGAYEFNL